MKLSYFPWGLAQPKNRHIIFYHNWMCLQSPTTWQRPQHVKSGGFAKAQGLSLVRDGPKFPCEQCAEPSRREEAPGVELLVGCSGAVGETGLWRGVPLTKAGKHRLILRKDLKATETVNASFRFGAEQQPRL